MACANMMLNSSDWTIQSGSTVNCTGLANGWAGIGSFLLAMFRASDNPVYLAAANQTVQLLLNAQNGGTWANSTAYPNNCTDVYEGAAGIVSFLLNMYSTTQNVTILNSAESALTWLGQIQGGNPYWPYFQGLSTYYTGYYYGSAGIADVMLQAYEVTGIPSYLTNATNAANYLCNQFISNGNKTYETITGTTQEYTGLAAGYAGIIKFLEDLSSINDTKGYCLGNVSAMMN